MSKDSKKLYAYLLYSRFKNNKHVLIGDIVTPVERGELVKGGTVIVTPLIKGKFFVKRLAEDCNYEGDFLPLVIDEEWEELGVTSDYLLWFLEQDFVIEYIKSNVVGVAMARVPLKVIYEMKIAIPNHFKLGEPVMPSYEEVEIDNQANPVRDLINSFYEDYRFNFDRGKYRTAAVLAGAFCEVILYQLLVEAGVEERILDNDNSLTLGRLISCVQLLGLDKDDDVRDENRGFPISHFIEVQKNRNRAIHTTLPARESDELKAEDFHYMEEIIKRFGI